ncbi:hypothetical protein EYF80_062391 [Liparis tanakae]|uniref:Uncharacterized protein n=1 Tax=Liparis tanakae TaxID=230148 RepID=A0A4Z2EFI2_9TELE|nr:hypothetical protein EYF80_062391 [Liparis tanakae]
MDPGVHGSMSPEVHESRGPWVHESRGLFDVSVDSDPFKAGGPPWELAPLCFLTLSASPCQASLTPSSQSSHLIVSALLLMVTRCLPLE